MQGRIDEGHHLPERITGSRADPFGTLTLMRENEANSSTTQNMMQNAVNTNRSSFRTTNRANKGTPNALPAMSTSAKPANVPPAPGMTGSKFPESPNIMQKLSEMTGNAEHNPVDNILSKGKELIFMKFGLGK